MFIVPGAGLAAYELLDGEETPTRDALGNNGVAIERARQGLAQELENLDNIIERHWNYISERPKRLWRTQGMVDGVMSNNPMQDTWELFSTYDQQVKALFASAEAPLSYADIQIVRDSISPLRDEVNRAFIDAKLCIRQQYR